MSRLKKFAVSLWSGQLMLVSNVVYTAVSIPLVWSYLGKEEFGVWAVVVQLTGFLALIDSGMSNSFCRLLIDHKDTRKDGQYGAMVKLAFIISCLQGVIILLLGVIGSYVAVAFLNMPQELQRDFHYLLIGQCALTMVNFCLRVFGLILYAHQRIDINNYLGTVQLLLSLALLAFFLREGTGLYAVLYANAASIILCAWVPVWVCCRYGYLPRRDEYGKIDWLLVKESTKYAMELFGVILGTQLTLTSQTLLIARIMGMEAAAIWAVVTKPFNLICQIVWKIPNYAAPALCEMYVREEFVRFKISFRDVMYLAGFLAAVAAAGLVVCNGDFVKIWVGGQAHWSWYNDLLLGVWFFVLSICRCYCELPLMVKQIRGLKYIYFLEGAVFVGVVLLWIGKVEFWEILLLSIITSLMFSGAYNFMKASQLLAFPKRELIRWHVGMFMTFVVLTGFGKLAYYMLSGVTAPVRLTVCTVLIGGLGAVVILKYGITSTRFGQLPPFIRYFARRNWPYIWFSK